MNSLILIKNLKKIFLFTRPFYKMRINLRILGLKKIFLIFTVFSMFECIFCRSGICVLIRSKKCGQLMIILMMLQLSTQKQQFSIKHFCTKYTQNCTIFLFTLINFNIFYSTTTETRNKFSKKCNLSMFLLKF